MSTIRLISTHPRPHAATTGHRQPLLENQNLEALIDKSKSIRHVLQTHAFILRHRHRIRHNHLPVLSLKLLRAYASHGRLRQSLFVLHLTENPDVYLFSAAINTMSMHNFHNRAVSLYVRMLTNNVYPNEFTFSSILKSCSIGSGNMVHTHVIKFGFRLDLYVATGLVDVYAKSGDVVSAQMVLDRMPERSLVSSTAMIKCYAEHGKLDAARLLFDEMPERDVVCWNVIIDGYAQNGMPGEALLLFRRMLAEKKLRPNEITIVAALSACGQLGAVQSGRWVHSYIENHPIRLNTRVSTALIDMYSKCGSLDDARLVFDQIPVKDVVAWNAMITGYAMHGFSKDALRLYDEMCTIGLQPTDITFIGILSACSHTGLVNEGWRFFNLMKKEHGIEPKIEHYGCMVNLLGRAGLLDEAYDFIRNMKIEADPVTWGALLGACGLHGNLTLGKEIAEFLVGRNLANSGTYVLLSNIYACVGNFEGVAKVRNLMKEHEIQKEPGLSTIEVDNKVHAFRAGDRRHPKSREIYMMLEEINDWLIDHGHVPQTCAVLHDIEEVEKQRLLEVHSEKLAIAFGLISTKPRTSLKIFKNLRVCFDCHAVAKLISKITGREIVMRDRNRFHHFVDGSCSCGDYW